MEYFSGISGQLYINGSKAARVSTWTLSANAGLLDTTSLGDTDRTSIYGTRSTTGNCALYYYQPTPGTNGDASTLLNALIKARIANSEPGVAPASDSVVLKLVIDDSTSAGKYVEIDANLTSASMTMAVGTVLQAAISFEANGAPRLVNI